MAELIAVTFDNEQEADRVLTELARLQKEYLIDLEDAVIVVQPRDGKVQLKQSISMVGTGPGALSGSLVDYGIDDDFIRSLGEKLKPGSSAMFVLVRKAQPEKVLSELSRFRGQVLRTSLSPEQQARLQAALEHSVAVR